MDGWVSEKVGGWMSRRMKRRVNKRINEWIN